MMAARWRTGVSTTLGIFLGIAGAEPAAGQISPSFGVSGLNVRELTAAERRVVEAVAGRFEQAQPGVGPITITFRFVPSLEGAIGAALRGAEDNLMPRKCSVRFAELFADGSPINWYVDPSPLTDGPGEVPANAHDLLSVAFHEIAHCVGFAGYFLFSRSLGPADGGGVWPVLTGGRRPWVFPPPPFGEPPCVQATLTPYLQGPHLDPATHPNGLMRPVLGLGVRLVPTATDLAVLDAAFGYGGSDAVCLPAIRDQSRDQERCASALNLGFAKVAAAQRREIASCVRDHARGRLQGITAEECLTSDRTLRLERARSWTEAAEAKSCVPPLPDVGAADAASVNAIAAAYEVDHLHDAFGPDIGASIDDETTDRTRSLCQQKVLKRLHKCTKTGLKFFNRCKKERLKGRVVDAGTLGECMWADQGLVIDGCIPIRKDVDRRCSEKGVALAAAFPGCGAPDVVSTAICLFQYATCRRCLALKEADGLVVDCDLFDDDVPNGSCL